MNDREKVLSRTDGSVTRWLEALKAGDRAAAGPLWDRYFSRMLRLARARLHLEARGLVAVDGEDVAIGAFESFCARAVLGRFPDLDDRHDLWQLLVVITNRKARAEARRQRRRKRGGGHVVRESDLSTDPEDGDAGGLERLADSDPGPALRAMAAESLEGLLDRLRDETLRQVAVWRLEGYTIDEIAVRLGRTRRTVARKLDLIRQAWSTDLPG